LKKVEGRDVVLPNKRKWGVEHPDNKWLKPKAAGGLMPNRQPGKEKKGCQADEWPPYVLYHEVDGYDRAIDPAFAHRAAINKPQFIRLIDGTENGNVGNKFGACKEIPDRHDTSSSTHSSVGADKTTTFFTDWTAVYTRIAYRIDPDASDPKGDDGISANDCYPRGVDNDNRYQGYALLNDDPWQKADDRKLQPGYLIDPPTNAKRNWLDADDIVSVGVNSSRRLTEEEYEGLQHRFGVAECNDGNCYDDGAVEAPILTSTTLVVEGMQPTGAIPMPQDSAGDAKLPRETLTI
jgi:hypothetical protein